MEIYSIGAFAKLTNVTVKTLRHYEQLGLVMPTYNPDNGYRRYNIAHINQIEAVLALKLLGFSLNDIAIYMKDDNQQLPLNLATQKIALSKKLSEIKQVIELITNIERSNLAYNPKAWIDLIKEMNMQNRNIAWYLNQTEDDMVKLGTYIPNAQETEQLKIKWINLIERADVQMNQFDAASFDKLADEWIATVGQFIDNKDTMKAIFNSYMEMDDWPKERQFFSVELGKFIGPKLIAKIA